MTPDEYKKTMTFVERNKNAAEYSLWRWWKNYTWAKFLFFLSPFVTILIILSIFLVPTMWGKCGETVRYHIVGTTLHVEGVGNMENYNHDPPWWPWHTLIRRVVVEDGVTSIGNDAFHEFWRLRSVEIPPSVTVIYGGAFRSCESLEEVNAPGVSVVFEEAFSGCTSLRTVTLCQWSPTVLMEAAFKDCSALESVSMNEVVTLWAYCFDGCASLDGLDYVLPERIGAFAFSGCSSLTSFPIERTAEDSEDQNRERVLRGAIGNGAFLRCSSLTRAELPEGVTVLPEHIFQDCTSLTDVTLPEGIHTIGEGAFYGCTALETLTLPESLRNIGKDAFTDCTGLTTLVIPDKIYRIDRTAFRRWTAEQTVLVPSLDVLPQGAAYSDARVEKKRS